MLSLLLRHSNRGINNIYRQRTALMNAVLTKRDKAEKVKLLLNAGADPNLQNDLGVTALMANFIFPTTLSMGDREKFVNDNNKD